MSAAKTSRKLPSPPTVVRGGEKASAPPQGDDAAKAAKRARKRRPRFVL